MIELGDIIVFNETKGIYPKLIRFFTGKPYTHTAIGIGDIAGFPSTFEAREVTTSRIWDKIQADKTIEYEVYEVTLEFKPAIQQACRDIFEEYNDYQYGYMQIPHFLHLWMMRKMGKNPKQEEPWFQEGIFCSEITYLALQSISKIKDYLDGWLINNFSPGDTADCLHRFPEVFKLKAMSPK
jgi:hypothetical protein